VAHSCLVRSFTRDMYMCQLSVVLHGCNNRNPVSHCDTLFATRNRVLHVQSAESSTRDRDHVQHAFSSARATPACTHVPVSTCQSRPTTDPHTTTSIILVPTSAISLSSLGRLRCQQPGHTLINDHSPCHPVQTLTLRPTPPRGTHPRSPPSSARPHRPRKHSRPRPPSTPLPHQQPLHPSPFLLQSSQP